MTGVQLDAAALIRKFCMTITPRTLKGFRDFLPPTMIPRERLIEIAKEVYRSFGYSPIDTPALEYAEILEGKGSAETDRQLYTFEDHGGRRVGLRFDLTVPLARFVAQHIGKLGTPFKRYHIAPVWRGENTQRGRYREFYQCDFDTIGTLSMVADTEMVLVIHDLMVALGIKSFVVRVNNRKVLNGLLEKHGLLEKSTLLLRALDKLPKIGRQKVLAEMMSVAGASRDQADQVLAMAEVTGDWESVLARLQELVTGSPTGELGIDQLRQVMTGALAAGVTADRLQLDVSIARGLDYYTGTIVETFLGDLPEIGSVCSGGRYDDLAGVYTKQKLPGVGASLGLDRLLAALEELNLLEAAKTTAPVFIPFFDAGRIHDYLRLANQIRQQGIGVEVYPEPKKLGQQLKYASEHGFRVAVIAGEQELSAGTCQVKNLDARTSVDVVLDDSGEALAAAIRAAMS